MSTFHFKLQTVLRLRSAERDSRREELAKGHRAEEILRGQQRQLEKEMADLKETTRRLSEPGRGDIDGLLRTHRYELLLRIQTQQLAAQMAQVQAETERRRLAVVEADRQVRVLEKLRERQMLAHRLHAEKQEAKQLDEVAALSYSRTAEGEL